MQAHERLESQERVAARTPSDDFALVYETHFQLVFRTLQRFGVPASQVDDAVQDVFLVVCRGLAAFRGESSLKTWIFGITLRVATGYTRRLRRQTQPLDVVAELQDRKSRHAAVNAEVCLTTGSTDDCHLQFAAIESALERTAAPCSLLVHSAALDGLGLAGTNSSRGAGWVELSSPRL